MTTRPFEVLPYPPWLEHWWVKAAARQLGRPDIAACLRELEREVQRLSDLFTVERSPGFSDYAQDERLLLAYGLFFFPQTFIRIQFPLIEAVAWRGWAPPSDRPMRVLDLGAGPGAAGLAVATLLEKVTESSAIEVTALDRAPTALGFFQAIVGDLSAYWPRTRWTFRVGDLRDPPTWGVPLDTPWDLIVVSFALGEAFYGQTDTRVYAWLRHVLRYLSPQGLLVITEPALRETSERLERLRDAVARAGWPFIWGPCLHHRPCPLLAEGCFWCHEVRRWTVPPSLADLNRRLYRMIQVLKFSFLTLSPQVPPALPAGPMWFRLIAPMAEMKGKFQTVGCASDGQKYTYEILRRHLDADGIARLRRIERGHILCVQDLQPVRASTWRIPNKAVS
ncbi:MAG: methyltransferase domain-containing protein [Acidobacteria bacterium]|nr:methyltransferase domain-containing protein [Acidobacteriota bacterium]MDW7985211.1 small ribosomal subunit Rsm22 family protein [Acidobacteriota bacterium]